MDFINPIAWFQGLSPEWVVLLTSMIPITEIRASIPIGLEYYHLPIIETWIIGVLGDLVPALILLFLLPKLNVWLRKNKYLGKIFENRLKKAEEKFSGDFAKYGAIALIIFIGIPLPLTGSWTGSLVAFVFNIPFKKSVPLITAGVMLAATIITVITFFAGGTLRWIFGL